MITIFLCIFIDYNTLHARILPVVGLSMACGFYFVDTFFLSESDPLWVSSIFNFYFLSGYGDISNLVLPNLIAYLRGIAYKFSGYMKIYLNLIWKCPIPGNHDNY